MAPMGEVAPARSHWPVVMAVGLIAGLGILWAILFFVVPFGEQNFPLNDDWAFARGAFTFARGEGLNYSHWSSMPQLGQWLWAWPFIEVLGESHAALRLSTIVLSLLGMLAFFDLLLQAGLRPARAAFVTACLALNPLFFELSGTFLTDVPALAFSLLALALYGRAFALASKNLPRAVDFLTLAVIVAVLGAISRQNTITVPVAAGLVLFGHPRLRFHPAWLLAVAIPAAAAVATHYWFKTRSDNYELLPKGGVDLGRFMLLAFTITHYMGLTALPVLVFEADVSSWRKPTVLVGFIGALCLMVAGAIFYGHRLDEPNALRDWWNAWADHGFWALFKEDSFILDKFPYLTNMFTAFGQFGLNEIVMGDRTEVLGRGLRVALTALGCVAGAALLVRASSRLRAGAWKNLLFLFAIVHVPFLFLPYVIFDRYYIVFMPAALYLATNPRLDTAYVPQRVLARRVIGIAILAVFGLFSVALMHDWLAWNAARWTLGRRAVDRGIAATDIEGGFEWNCWYAPVPPFARRQDPRSDLLLPYTNMMFGHISGRFALSFSVPPGATVLDREPYTTWLGPGRHDFYLVEQHKMEGPGP